MEGACRCPRAVSAAPRVAAGEDRYREGSSSFVNRVDGDRGRLRGRPRRLVRAEEGDRDQLPARVVAGLVADAGVAGIPQGERPGFRERAVGGRVDLGYEAGEAEDSSVGGIVLDLDRLCNLDTKSLAWHEK